MLNEHATPPLSVGIGLRSPHVREVLQTRPPVAWWEVHSENYFGGGQNRAALMAVREHYPVSLHGVGLGLGSVQPLDPHHLDQLAELVSAVEPALISEHLCWNRLPGRVINDLLPVPATFEAVALLVERIGQVQDRLKRPLLIENVSAYVAFQGEEMTEAELLAELVRRTGCGVLLDVNNIHVNHVNLGVDPQRFLETLPVDCVGEIHVAGFTQADGFLIDTHGDHVSPPVWELLSAAYRRFGPQPTLLEWDTDIPALSVLQAEAAEALRRWEETAHV